MKKKSVEDKKPVDPEKERLQAESEARRQAIVDAQFDAFKLGEVYKADLKCANNIKCKHSMSIDLTSPNEILRSGLKENYAIYSQEIESFVTSQSYRSMRLLTEYSFGYSPKEWKALLEKGMWVPLSLTLDENRQIHSYKIMKSYPDVLPEQVVSALNDLYKLKEGMTNRYMTYDSTSDDVSLSINARPDDNKILVTIFARDKGHT